VTYTFTAGSPGTRAYYSGSQSDLQVEMGMYGAIIVLPASVPGNCTTGLAASNLAAEAHWGEKDFRLSQAAYDHAKTCYDREYLFQFCRDGWQHSQSGIGPGHGNQWVYGWVAGMQPQCPDRALPPLLLRDQRTFDAR